MRREASIHITEKELAQVLREVFKDQGLSKKSCMESMKLAPLILRKAKTRALTSRALYVTNQQLLKKSEKLQTSGRSDASVFSQLLIFIRRRLKHRGIEIIKPGEKQWLEVKEVCGLATEFCNEFGLPIKEGYKIYIEEALKIMKNYSLNRFKSLHGTVCQRYEALKEIQEDRWPEITTMIYEYYLKKVNEKIGWVANNFKEDPLKYVCFVRVRKEIQKIGVKPREYIDAQFAGLEWANAIPDPCQMTGIKAVERLTKYCYENDIKVGKNIKLDGVKVDFSKIKRNGKNYSE